MNSEDYGSFFSPKVGKASGLPRFLKYRNGLILSCQSWVLPDSLERRLIPGPSGHLLSLHSRLSEDEVIGFTDFFFFWKTILVSMTLVNFSRKSLLWTFSPPNWFSLFCIMCFLVKWLNPLINTKGCEYVFYWVKLTFYGLF